MFYGRKKIPDNIIEKIAPILNVSPEEIKGWILADKYSKEILQRALQLRQEHIEQHKLIFTTKTHELMETKNLSISAFSREIHYNQGWLSQILLGNQPVSKKLMQKICNFSGIFEDEIRSWIVADKYSPVAIEVAVRESA